MARGDLLRTFPATATTPLGLAWDGRVLYVADLASANIFVIDPRLGTLLRTIALPNAANGVAFHGAHLYWTDDIANEIVQMTPTGVEVRRFAALGTTPRGIECDGRSLFQNDDVLDATGQTDSRAAVTFRTWGNSPGTRGIAHNGRILYEVVTSTGNVELRDARTGTVLATFATAGVQPTGAVVKDEGPFFIADNTANTVQQRTP